MAPLDRSTLSGQLLPILLTAALIAAISPLHTEWPVLAFSIAFLVPTGLELLDVACPRWYFYWAGMALAAYFLRFFLEMNQASGLDVAPALMTLPYLTGAVLTSFPEFWKLLHFRKMMLADWLRVFALGYWVTAAAWLQLSMLDLRPFHFDPVIVFLTAAHFHVAGFALTVIARKWWMLQPDGLRRSLAWGMLAGMPVVAFGITFTQTGGAVQVEVLAACFFALMALVLAGSQWRLAAGFPADRRWKLRLGAACLMLAMLLAAGYGLRFYFLTEWLTIPNMKIWHGALNALGFAWFTFLGLMPSPIPPALKSSRHFPR